MKQDLILDQFSGPLDLLLHLIDEKEMNISDLAISAVTEQYLAYVESLEQVEADELADFLVIAARLVLLKARALLPQFLPEEDEGPDLADQLKQYKRFIELSKHVQQAWLAPSFGALRIEPPRKMAAFHGPQNVSTKQLTKTMAAIIERLTPLKPLPKTHIDGRISLKQKIKDLQSLFLKRKQADFFAVTDAENKTDLIVSFLALLELSKQRYITTKQHALFGDITISKV